MAKRRKNSTALFEVMAAHRARQQPGNGSSVAPTPASRSYAPPPGQLQMSRPPRPSLLDAGRQWLSGVLERRQGVSEEPAPVVAAPLDPSDPTAGMTAESLSARTLAPGAAQNQTAPATAPATRPPVALAPAVAVAPEPNAPAAVDFTDRRTADRTSVKPVNEVEFDRDKHQVTLKVRYNTAIIWGFAILVTVGLAYIVGTHSGNTPAKPAAKKPAVTPVKPDGTAVAGDARSASERVTGDSGLAGVQSNGPLDITQRLPSGAFEDAAMNGSAARRTPRLNYCVIQSYNPDFQETAIEVSHFLNSQGIPNTIEIGSSRLGGSQTGWYLLVGTRGFTKGFSTTPEYEQYMQAIHAAAAKFPQKSKLGRPQTYMVKWPE